MDKLTNKTPDQVTELLQLTEEQSAKFRDAFDRFVMGQAENLAIHPFTVTSAIFGVICGLAAANGTKREELLATVNLVFDSLAPLLAGTSSGSTTETAKDSSTESKPKR